MSVSIDNNLSTSSLQFDSPNSPQSSGNSIADLEQILAEVLQMLEQMLQQAISTQNQQTGMDPNGGGGSQPGGNAGGMTGAGGPADGGGAPGAGDPAGGGGAPGAGGPAGGGGAPGAGGPAADGGAPGAQGPTGNGSASDTCGGSKDAGSQSELSQLQSMMNDVKQMQKELAQQLGQSGGNTQQGPTDMQMIDQMEKLLAQLKQMMQPKQASGPSGI